MKISSILSRVPSGLLGLMLVGSVVVGVCRADEYRSRPPVGATRPWLGPEFWANRLQDWRLDDGWYECVARDAKEPYRTAHLLTHRLVDGRGPFAIEVAIERIGDGPSNPDAAAGLLIGVGGGRMDYRAASMVHRNPGEGGGQFLGVDPRGRPFLRSFEHPAGFDPKADPQGPAIDAYRLRVEGIKDTHGQWKLHASTFTIKNSAEVASVDLDWPGSSPIEGGLALVSHPGAGEHPARFRFRELRANGPGVVADEDRRFGPIASTLYTVHDGVLKLTAQFLPIGADATRTARLEVERGDDWMCVAEAEIAAMSETATFRVEGWDSRSEARYRVVHEAEGAESDVYPGIIRRDPVERDVIVLAALSCVEQFGGGPRGDRSFPWASRTWFPHDDLVPKLLVHEPDLYFFAGDQSYEGNPTPPDRAPIGDAILDYQYKWLMWCWSFRDLTRVTPAVVLADDHDMFQGNIWGMGGLPSAPGDPAGLRGGYGMPAEWVNAVQRTQTSHLPDSPDPEPVAQGIEVYFTNLTVGRVGFAIFEDRKFKSSPSIVPAPMTFDSHIVDPDYDTRQADVPGAKLLGRRQLEFLRDFSDDWRGQDLKAGLSQTIFANLQISSRGETAGRLDVDLDSNGWPQSGRSAALRALRRGYAVHVAGDQHLASVIHHGIDDYDDGPYSFCVPAVANLYPRLWNPDYPPLDPDPARARFLGRYRDGFRNKLDVIAVANPTLDPEPGQFPEPQELYREGTGYGIVRFDKAARTVTFEAWPRHVDPDAGRPYDGWPVTVSQRGNDGREPVGWLPEFVCLDLENPVSRTIQESTGEVVSTIRIRGRRYRPPVFEPGRYTLEVGEPDAEVWRTFKGLTPSETATEGPIEVRLR